MEGVRNWKVIVKGSGASPGLFSGRATIIRDPCRTDKEKCSGRILVMPFATPFEYDLMLVAGAIVTDHGGVTSHAASVARELGIPCVVACECATSLIKEGMEILVNGQSGEISAATT